MSGINPNLAVDLSSVKESQATDLSKEAIAARDRERRLKAAADWVARMRTMTKGLAGAPTRRQHVLAAIEKFNLQES